LKPYEGIPVDFALYRIMYQLFDKDVLDTARDNNIDKDVRTNFSKSIAQKIAQESMVLLKNDKRHDFAERSVLPLDEG
jgi:hypothetical protein